MCCTYTHAGQIFTRISKINIFLILIKYWSALFALLWGSHPINAAQHCVRRCCELQPESPLGPLKKGCGLAQEVPYLAVRER